MRMYPLSRRDFIKRTLFGVCGAALLPAPLALAGEGAPERFLGKTRTPVSLLSIHVPSLAKGKTDEEVVGLIRKAVDVCGKPVISLAGKGQAEASKLAGNALRGGYRRKAFVSAATTATDKQSALAELELTLNALQTDSLDLWLLDESIYHHESELIFTHDGLISAAIEAKQRGLTQHLGFRGYREAQFFEHMYGGYFDFDAVEIPIDGLDPYYEQFQRDVLPRLRVRNYGIIAVNPAPVRTMGFNAGAEIVFPLLWSQLVSTIAVGFESEQRLQQLAEIAQGFKTVPPEKRNELIKEIAGKAGARS